MAVYNPEACEKFADKREDKKRRKEIEALTILNKIAGCVQMKQGLDLSNDRIEEEVVWASATVNTLVWDKLISDKGRKEKKLKKAHDRKMKHIA